MVDDMRERIKIILDACTPIDLNIPKVNSLEICLKYLNEEDVYISLVNFEEIKDQNIQNLLKNYNVKIVENDENDFEKFSKELESLKLNLSIKDRHVLLLAYNQRADFVVSSDFNVLDKTSRYQKNKNLKFMKTWSTVLLLDYLYNKGKISFKLFFEKSLNLFKYKEIENIFLNHLRDKNLNVTKQEQNDILIEFEKFTRKRFQDYKNPLIDEMRQLKLE